jgi:peptide chain release factor 2
MRPGAAGCGYRPQSARPGRPGTAVVTSTTVPADDFDTALSALDGTLTRIEQVSDVVAMRARIGELEQQVGAPGLWDDQDNAQRVTSELSHTQADLTQLASLRTRVDDLHVLAELAAEEDDAGTAEATRAEADTELAALRTQIDELEVRTLLSGEYDAREALITVRAEAGGVDAADFAEMLLRMYLRYAERHGWATDVFDTSYAEEAGIKTATFSVQAPYAYGTLSVEQGTHRLVRISPVDIDEDDLRVDVYRSSGPGGQGVNTTDSAVRITHLPTGIVVSCQNERSQIQNRASAMAVLAAKLLERRRQEEQATLDAMKDSSGGSWGNQIRSYVLHPYQMVKDLRTGHEVGNTQAVFDGDIDGFVEAGIRWRRSGEAGGAAA